MKERSLFKKIRHFFHKMKNRYFILVEGSLLFNIDLGAKG